MKAIWLIIVLIGMCSCGTSEKAATVETQTERWNASKDSLLLQQAASLKEDEIVRRLGAIRLRWTEYDTGKSALPSTGKPPVRKEGEAQIGLKSEHLLHTDYTDSTRMESSRRSASEEEEECRTAEEKKTGNTGHIGATVVALLVFAIVIYAIKKRLAE